MVNKVFLVGRLGKDPVIKHFQNDSAIAEFSLATTENFKDRDGNWKEITDWHNIKLPNKFQAERAEKYLKKGSLIHVEGKLRTRSYDDKDGNKRYVTEVVVEQFKMLDKKQDAAANAENGSSYSTPSNSPASEEPAVTTSAPEDDLPF